MRRRYQPPGGLEVNCGSAMTAQRRILVNAAGPGRMIPKSGARFSEKIMLHV
jgi:hypothetical protein